MFRKAKAAEGAQILPWHQTFAVGIIMSMLAGYLEAYTYTLRGNVFCNGQTSNIALMMINFFRGNTAKALYYPIPILAFSSSARSLPRFCAAAASSCAGREWRC